MKKYLFAVIAALGLVSVQAQTDQVPNLMGQLVVTNTYTATNITVYTPDSANQSGIQEGLNIILSALHDSTSNSYWVVYAMHAKGLPKAWGGGVAWVAPLNKYFLTGVRVDYVDGAFWMPSVNATMQLPIKLGPTTLTPFIYEGVGLPLSGAKFSVGQFGVTVPGKAVDNNGQATAITGIGLSLDIHKGADWDLRAVADIESWSGFPGNQERFGIAYSSNRKGLFGIGILGL